MILHPSGHGKIGTYHIVATGIMGNGFPQAVSETA